MRKIVRSWWQLSGRIIILLAYGYPAGIILWLLLNAFWPDQWWWQYLLSSFSVYLFLPTLLLPIVALFSRQRRLWLAFVLLGGLWFGLYGWAWWPNDPAGSTNAPTLTVMTYNCLASNRHPEDVIATIERSQADVVVLQELNRTTAAFIGRQLAETYPFRWLEDESGVAGMGVISRYPLQPLDPLAEGYWVGHPQPFTISFAGQVVTMLNFHAISPGGVNPIRLASNIAAREESARVIQQIATQTPGPLLAMGDLNASDSSRTYRIITTVLNDAWREAGWGLGHTFPNSRPTYNQRTLLPGLPIPAGLVRIDYVFHSAHWLAIAADVLEDGQRSDHRPVVVTLALVK